jgi:hypothetical protein
MKALYKVLKKTAIRIAATLLTKGLNVYRKFRPLPAAIYFCYNQSVHHIYHSIYIAIEMSRIQKKYPVVILSTNREASEIIEKELKSIPHNVIFKKIRHFGYNRVDFDVNWFVFLCRLHMHNPKAVVVTDYYDNVFRQLGVRTFWAFTNHGLENRGFTHPHIKDYDLIVIAGEGELGRLESRVGKLNNYIIAGYSKFDYFYYHHQAPLQLFRDSRPVVIYNPHFDEAQTSFFDKGQELLQALDACAKFNVIFMPHPDLFRRFPKDMDKIRGLSSTVFSERTRINLDYMASADIYITDVSSSVFEWLYFNKPTLFFNVKKENKDKYPAWALGRVVEDVPEMLGAIEDSLRGPDEFEFQRKNMFSETFSNQDKNVSRIAAQGIWGKLEELAHKPQFFVFGKISDKRGLRGVRGVG